MTTNLPSDPWKLAQLLSETSQRFADQIAIPEGVSSVEELIKQSPHTEKEVFEALEISKTAWYRLKRNFKLMSLENTEKMAGILGVSTFSLFRLILEKTSKKN